jgi:heptosyltransferase-2
MSQNPHLLLMPPNWIGDAIMAQPAMVAIARHYHTSNISICGKSWLQDLLPYLGISHAQYLSDIPKADIGFIFSNSFRSALQCWQAGVSERIAYSGQWRRALLTRALPQHISMKHEHHRNFYLDMAKQLNINVASSEVHLLAPDGEEEAGRRIMRVHGLEPDRVICIAPGAQFGAAKCYPAQSYALVVQNLAKAGWQPLILGMQEDRGVGDEILKEIHTPHQNIAGTTSLSEALQLISACRLMLCNDSGLMHIAAGLGKPTVTPFGATDPARTSPSGTQVHVLYQPADCSPCLQRECTVPDHPCMTNITAQMLTDACLAMLDD